MCTGRIVLLVQKKHSRSEDFSTPRRKRGETEDTVLSRAAYTDIAQIIFQKEDFRFLCSPMAGFICKTCEESIPDIP